MEDKEMTEDIWGEKPIPFEEERYPHGIMRNPVYYQVSEMDTWLEKLKVEYDKLKEKADAMSSFRKAAEDLGEYAADLDDKLEAIKEIAKNAPGGVLKDDDTPEDFVKVDTFMRYYRAICEILGILEAGA